MEAPFLALDFCAVRARREAEIPGLILMRIVRDRKGKVWEILGILCSLFFGSLDRFSLVRVRGLRGRCAAEKRLRLRLD